MTTNSPAALCRQLEEEQRRPSGLPLRPSPATVRAAELDAAQAQHALDMADESTPGARLDALRRKAGEARALAQPGEMLGRLP